MGSYLYEAILRMYMDVTLIQCTASKRDETAPAKDLYDKSPYFCKMREWAIARACPWYILSAKTQLVAPERVLEPYDERGLSDYQAGEIADQLERKDVDTVHICAGRDYTDPLIPELERRGIDVIEHFSGERIGARMKLLKERTRELNA
jgi:hypothetical protein